MRLEVAAIIDGFSRKIMSLKVFQGSPTTPELVDLIDEAVEEAHDTPKYIVSDRGSQFQGAFRHALRARSIQHARSRSGPDSSTPRSNNRDHGEAKASFNGVAKRRYAKAQQTAAQPHATKLYDRRRSRPEDSTNANAIIQPLSPLRTLLYCVRMAALKKM